MARPLRFAPAVYEHAAALLGRTPHAVSRDPELLFQAHAKAFGLYGHSPVVVGGNTLPILDSLLETGTGYVICPCETDQAAFMRKMEDRPEVMVRINTDSRAFASGDIAAVYHELDRVLALAGARERVCIGTGALPFETNPELVLNAKEYVRNWTRSPRPGLPATLPLSAATRNR
jgi:hypothetical protein